MAKPIDTTGVTTYDLTDTTILTASPSVRTPIDTLQFVLRNRIDWTNDVGSSRPTLDAHAGASSTALANIFRVLKVPKRTVVHSISLHTETTSWAHSHTGSVGASAVLNFQACCYKTASQTSVVRTANGFGYLAITASGGAISGLPTVSASTPWTAAQLPTVTNAAQPVFFPYGGFIELQMSGGASTQNVTGDGSFTGIGEIQAHCTSVPE